MAINQFVRRVLIGPFELWQRYRNPRFWLCLEHFRPYVLRYDWVSGQIVFRQGDGEDNDAALDAVTWLQELDEPELDGFEPACSDSEFFVRGVSEFTNREGREVVRIEPF